MDSKMYTHYKPKNFSDLVAFGFTKLLRLFADLFFKKRYGHRAVILETVAAVPGMVAGMLNHLKSLRKMQNDNGWIKTLLDEAENERMHLMTFIEIAKPSIFERFLVILVQGIFFNLYFPIRIKKRYLLFGAILTSISWYSLSYLFDFFINISTFYGTFFGGMRGLFISLIFRLTSLFVILDRFFFIFSTSEPFFPITNPGLDV